MNRLPAEGPRVEPARHFMLVSPTGATPATIAAGVLLGMPWPGPSTLFVQPRTDGLIGQAVMTRPGQDPDELDRIGAPHGWVRVAGVVERGGDPAVLTARIVDELRRRSGKKAEPALEDEVLRVQAKRAEGMEPLKARRVLRAAARTLVRRGGLTAERFAAIKSELLATKARLLDQRRN